jgi:glyoxylase-like metal-dependent hydrolase (beta-lactamase superfamily II)
VREIDVHHCGVARAICCFADEDEGWLVDPGPESSHEALLEALPDGWAPRRILLTHIHFDHAGATGALLRRWPDAEVWVHERGAPHMIDPTKLVNSAKRIYGDDFDRLWGEVVPIAEDHVRVLRGGEAIDGWRVEYTPGHASHHVCYLHERSGTAFCGDVAGVRILDGPIFPPTPPPDIDLDAWHESLNTVAAWAPTALACTHFGAFGDVTVHLEEMHDALNRWGELARTTDADGYAAAVRAYVEEHTGGAVTRAGYEQANPPGTLYAGLSRYWEKKAERDAAA